jgi:thioredoxin-like negative regulator of GroEL
VARSPSSLAVLVACAALLACAARGRPALEEDYRAHLEEAHLALRAGDPDDAEDAYRRALDLRPDSAAALHGLARTHAARGDGRAALTLLWRLEQEHPEYFRSRAQADLRFALYQAAKQNLWAGDSARALELVHRLEALDPAHGGLGELRTDAQLWEAARLYVGGRLYEAEALIGAVVGRRVTGAEAARLLAEALIERRRTAPAISVLSDAMTRHPREIQLRQLMDRALEIRYPDSLPRLDGEPWPSRGRP